MPPSTDCLSEDLTKASQTASLLIADLRSALHRATAVEALVLLPLISQAAQLEQGIQALELARAER